MSKNTNETGNEIKKSLAIAKNLEKKNERKAKGNLLLKVNDLAQNLAKREVELTGDQEDRFWEFIDFVESGKEAVKNDEMGPIGSTGGKREGKGLCIGWYKTRFIIFGAGIEINFANRVVFDYLGGEIFDIKNKKRLPMTDATIGQYMKEVSA